MEKEFIPYEQALALKELGFDEDCFGYYVNAELDLTWKFSDCSLYQDTHISILAPLYQQAFRWFREKYLLEGLILPQIHSGLNPFPAYFIGIESYKNEMWKELFNSTNEFTLLHYSSYKDAELACLQKLIEIVKNDNRTN